ncbi:MAG: sensor signal transduction histidine kinase [Acidobacteriales bacterium]|nr:sensor signal transduction histidine kinase [Terriglobales bacterium]
MGPGVDVTAVLPLNDRSRDLILELAQALQPYFPDIIANWRMRILQEFTLCERTLATLERVTVATGSSYFLHSDFNGFFENVEYFGIRLAKLEVDTRVVKRALEISEDVCEPYVGSIFGERRTQFQVAMGMLSSSTFGAISAAYFDARAKESQSLLAILDVELADRSLETMLQRVLEITCETFEAVIGLVLLRDEESDLLRVHASVGVDPKMRGEFSVTLGQGICGAIARSGEPELVLNASQDDRIVHQELKVLATTLWGVPLKYNGKTIGVMLIGFAKPYEWMPTERGLMRAIADRSAMAIDRAQMTQMLRERETKIAELSSHLLRAQEEERTRISRELHDETGQGLMVIRLYLDMLQASLSGRAPKDKVQEALDVVDRTIDGIRRIIARLSPLVLQELGLSAALRKEAKDLEKNAGVKTRVAISDEVGRLSQETETTVYRIVQEALHNVAKHAQANKASVSMTRNNGTVKLLVEDDGIGIFPKSNFRGNSFGLAGIKERVAMLGGVVRVVSLKGKGTRIEIEVPATERVAGKEQVLEIPPPQVMYAASAEGGESDTNA